MPSDEDTPPAEEVEEATDTLESLPPLDVEALYPGAHQDPVTSEWILQEGGPDPRRKANGRGNGKRTITKRGIEHLRDRLYTGVTIQSLPALAPLVDGLLYLPGESVLYSRPKLAKTFLAIDLALSIATGREWMGRTVEQGRVLYVAGEGVGGMGQRVKAWSEYTGETMLGGCSFLTTGVNLGDKHGMGAMLELVEELEPILVVFDTLARCTPGLDENAAQDMGKVVASLDAVRGEHGHVMCLHHVGKDETRGMRGSTALLGAVDTTIQLTGTADEIRCVNDAQKDAEPAEDMWCALTRVGESAVIETMDRAAAGRAGGNAALEALLGLPATDRTATNWKRNAEASGMSERTFWRSKRELLEGGTVTATSEGRGALYEVTEPPEDEVEDDDLALDGVK